MLSRKKLLLYNTISSSALQIITIASGFILPIFFIRFYGAESYGIIVSVTQYLQLISLCELGIGAVIQSALYIPIAQSDMGRISSVYVASQTFFRKIAYILICYVLLLFAFYPFLSDGQVGWHISTPIIFAIALKLFLQYYFGISYRILLNAAQYIFLQAGISSITLLANLILSIILIKKHCSLSFVLIISAVVFILQPVLMHLAVNKIFLINTKAHFDKSTIPQKWNGVSQHLATVTLENVPVILLTAMTSMSTVAIYALYHMITNGIKLAFTTVLNNMNPLLGNIIANNETANLSRTFNKFVWLTNNICFLFFTVAAIVIVPFLEVYTLKMQNNAMYILPVFGYCMCFAMLVYVLRLPFNYLIQAAGHYKQTQNSAIIEALLNLIVSFIGIKLIGLIGVALAISIALIYRLIYFLSYVNNITSFSRVKYVKMLAIQIMLSAILIYASNLINPGHIINYYDWLVYSVKVFTLGLTIYFIGNLIFFHSYSISILSKLKHN